ncbi:uncharacterized protein LOC115415500 [Sphaeramia orbicularis]|uniref:uncharacterized protein LOC115415500 n=1 Tax=Sphaeramia orbicularis TaxID=375764 RepID=UPI00117DC835|nr:uncharacterized protein LOC115415500 [Sphaeramia orbicularis]
MGEFTWITLSLVFLQLTVTGETVAVQNGGDVSLPCGNVMDGQHKCDGTSWNFLGKTPTVELVGHGQINPEFQSDRLDVTADCSLLIKNVAVEDTGLYTCQQFRNHQKQRGDFMIYLSVVTLTEHQDTDKVTFTCSVWRYKQCEHDVSWLVDGGNMDIHRRDLKRLDGICTTDAKFHLDYKPENSDSLQCKVTDAYSNVYLFTFKSTGGDAPKPAVESTEEQMTTPASETRKNVTNQVWIRFFIGFVGLTALSVTAVVLPKWMKRKRNNSQISHSDVTVTYRAAASSSSASVSINPDDFYENADYGNH